MLSFWKEVQAHNRSVRQEMIDEEVACVQREDIVKTVLILIEVKVKEEKIKELLIKYWDLRPSDAVYFLQVAKEEQCQKK